MSRGERATAGPDPHMRDALAAIAGSEERWAEFAVEGVPVESSAPVPTAMWCATFDGSSTRPLEMLMDAQRALMASLAALVPPVLDDPAAPPEERARRAALTLMVLGETVTTPDTRRFGAMLDRACWLVGRTHWETDAGQAERLRGDLIAWRHVERKQAGAERGH